MVLKNLTINDMSDSLYQSLQAQARCNHRSVSQEVIEIIQDQLAQPKDPVAATEAFLALSGSWKGERSTQEMCSDIQRSRQRRKGRM